MRRAYHLTPILRTQASHFRCPPVYCSRCVLRVYVWCWRHAREGVPRIGPGLVESVLLIFILFPEDAMVHVVPTTSVGERHHAGGAQHELMNCSGTTFWAYFLSRSIFQSPPFFPARGVSHYLCTSAEPPGTLLSATLTTGSSSQLVPSSARCLWQLSVCSSISSH